MMLRRSLAVLLVVGLASAENVRVLVDDNFDTELEDMETALVMFYAPWCGHCKRLKPEFEKAAGDLLANDPPVHLVKVDCTEGGKDACGRFDVKGYPTLKIFRNGELSQEYNGPREAAGITKFMKSQVGPASKELTSQAELDAFLAKPEVAVVSFLKKGSDAQEVFLKTAAALREKVALAHYYGSSQDEAVVLYRPKHLQTKLEPSTLTFEGEVKKDALTKWINANYHGLVGHRTFDNAADFGEPLVLAYFGVDYVKNVKGTNYWRNRIMKVAKDFAGEFTFAISNKDDFLQEAQEFGLSSIAEDKPQAVARVAGKKYVMEDEFSVDALKKFVEDQKAGKVEPYLKSEPVPESNDGPVKVAVGKNFDALVTESDKDVLVEFYAPWCGHCKKLTPIFDELGEKMAGEDVEIVKMDATANDVPSGYDVRGFPTLYWLPKDTKKAVSYPGGRELDDFVKYIAKEATSELKGFDRKGKAKKTEL